MFCVPMAIEVFEEPAEGRSLDRILFRGWGGMIHGAS